MQNNHCIETLKTIAPFSRNLTNLFFNYFGILLDFSAKHGQFVNKTKDCKTYFDFRDIGDQTQTKDIL